MPVDTPNGKLKYMYGLEEPKEIDITHLSEPTELYNEDTLHYSHEGNIVGKIAGMYVDGDGITLTFGTGAMFFLPEIKKVIFNEPATIIIWTDGTKTVVKCSPNDVWDPEKGFAMAYLKKILGVKKYKNDFKKYVEYDSVIDLQALLDFVNAPFNITLKEKKDALGT